MSSLYAYYCEINNLTKNVNKSKNVFFQMFMTIQILMEINV